MLMISADVIFLYTVVKNRTLLYFHINTANIGQYQ